MAGRVAILVVVLAGLAPTATAADPFPIRRVLLPPEKAAAVSKFADGPVRRMPRAGFESLVQKAARAAAVPLPRLVAATYRATLVGTDLVGSGEWAVVAPPAGGLLPLDPLRVAVRAAAWDDGRDALLSRPGNAATTTLWVDRPGPHAVRFDWSARGTEEPGERRFDLRLPAAPVAVLELELETGQVPVPGQADQLLTGPYPGPDDATAVWRLAFGGQPRAEFAVRGPGETGHPPPFTRAARAARFDLAPGLATAAIDLDLESVRGPVDGWLFDVDPRLRVTDVTATGLDGWQLTPPPAPGRPARLTVRLREPTANGRVGVVGFASMSADGGSWPCPLVRPAAGTVGDDTIEVRFGPDLEVEAWTGGDYRPVRTAPTTDRGQAVTLKGTLAAADAPARRPPTVRVRPAAAAFTTTESLDWRIDPARPGLTAKFSVTVTRGPLARFAFRLPPGFTPTSASLTPDDPAAEFRPGPNGTWVLEPSRSLPTGQAAEVRLELRGPPPPPLRDPAAGRTPPRAALPFPAVVPLGAAARDGTLSIAVADAYRGWAVPPPGEASLTYRYAGREPDGTLYVTPRRAAVAATSDTAVSLAAGRLTAAHTLVVAPAAAVAGLTVFAPTDRRFAWDGPPAAGPGAAVRPLPAGEALPWLRLLAPGHSVAAAGLPFASPGQFWQIAIPRPVRDDITLTLRGSGPAGGPVALPMPVVLGADRGRATVSLALSAAGLTPVPPPAGDALPVLRLVPRDGAPAAEPASPWQFADLTRSTAVDEVGAVGTLAGRVVAAAGLALPVTLPAGAVVESATVDGKWADAAVEAGADGRPLVRMPIPDPGGDGTPFELRYRLPATAGWPAARVESRSPELPGDPPAPHAWSASIDCRLWPTLGRESAAGGVAAWVVPAGLPPLAGMIAAALLAGAVIARLVAAHRPCAVAAALGTVAWLLPDGWSPVVQPPLVVALAALPVAVAARRRGGRVQPADRSPTPLRPRPAAAAVGLLVAAAVVIAQPPEPTTVFLVPGADGYAALVPQSVLDRLAALTAPAVPPVVVTAAEYDGREADTGAVFDARFTVHVTADGPQTLALPLAGVRLERMTLDGKPAYPDAAADRYAVAVTGQGVHELVARFAVPVAAAGPDRQVRFGGPDLPAARVRFAAGPAARQLTVPPRRGAEQVEGTAVDADLGGGRVVAVRWRVGPAAAARASTTVTAAAVWDLSESDAALTAAFLYRVEAGSLARLTFALPPGLEPGRVAVRPLDESAGQPNGVRRWSLTEAADGAQAFNLELQNPIEGPTLVVFRLVPRGPASARPALRVPRAVGVTPAAGYVGVRLAGLTADRWEQENLADFPADAVAKDFPAVPELALDRRPLTRSFRWDGAGPAVVRPALRGSADPPPVGQELVWSVGPRADVDGTVRWPREATGGAVEFDVPAAVAVSAVRAADLAGWFRSGSRVRAWFRSAAKEPVVHWSGTWGGYPLPPGNLPPTSFPIDLPSSTTPAVVRVRPADGWVVVPPGRGPTPVPPTHPREIAFAAAPPPRFVVYPPVEVAAVRLTEMVERAGAELAYRVEASARLPDGRPHHLAVTAADLPAGSDPRLDVPAGVAVAEAPPGPNARRWELTVPAGAAGGFTAAVGLRLPAGSDVRLPRIELLPGGRPADEVERRLSVRAADLRPAVGSGWRSVGAGEWAVPADEAVRLTSPPAPPPTVPPAAPGTASPSAVAAPDAGEPLPRWAAATGWLAGLIAVGVLVRRGPWGLWPEYLTLFGLLAASAAGAGFLAASAVGVATRGRWAWRQVAGWVVR